MPSQIIYDPTLNLAAGYVGLQLPAADAADGPPLRPQDGKTLLALLFTLLYTKPGRDLMRNNKPVNGQLSDAQRQTLLDAFSNLGGVTSPDLQNALVDAHIAADTWATSFKSDPTNDGARATVEKVYLQKMAFITWCLWEDAKGHEFSMGW
jgi:hypothetical protein